MNLPASAAHARGPFTLLARCIRGTEWILAAETETRLAPDTIMLAHRSVQFSLPTPPPLESLRLATADDIFLVIGEIDGLDRTRESLGRLRARASELPWSDTLNDLTLLRPRPSWAAITISASSLGRRNYNRHEIEAAVAEGIEAAVAQGAADELGLPYRSSRVSQPADPELSIRVHLEGARATVAVRIFDAPLHRRPYKVHTCSGTLHPPLAAAMAMVAGLRPDSSVLDPFSGVGTIPVEAELLQPLASVSGSDIDGERLHHAECHACRAGTAVTFSKADAAHLPWPSQTFSHIVSNVPWQHTVAFRGHLARSPGRRDRELARVLEPAGRAVLLVHPDDPLATRNDGTNGMTLLHRSWLSTFGQHPRLCILSREGDDSIGAIDTDAPWGPALARWADHADTREA